MANFEIVHNGVGLWRKGDVISDTDVHDLLKDGRDAHGNDVKYNDKHRNAAVQRLLDIGAVKPTDAARQISGDGNSSPQHTKGDTAEAGDTVEDRAARRAEAVGAGNTGTQSTGDAAEKANPSAGKPGKITRPGAKE